MGGREVSREEDSRRGTFSTSNGDIIVLEKNYFERCRVRWATVRVAPHFRNFSWIGGSVARSEGRSTVLLAACVTIDLARRAWRGKSFEHFAATGESMDTDKTVFNRKYIFNVTYSIFKKNCNFVSFFSLLTLEYSSISFLFYFNLRYTFHFPISFAYIIHRLNATLILSYLTYIFNEITNYNEKQYCFKSPYKLKIG